MRHITYDRTLVYDYAALWAFSRNPLYYSFSIFGGDDTSFASQCIFAGCGVMNFAPDGWYYTSLNDRSPSWSGAEFLAAFLTSNTFAGPYAECASPSEMKCGDIIQLSQDSITFTQTLIVTRSSHRGSKSSILTASHSPDAFNRPLSTYSYKSLRCLKIIGARA